MSTTVKASIASQLAALSQVTGHAVEPFGYGSDLSCDSDLDPYMPEVDPNSTLALAQALVRRFDCPRGALPDDPNYGIDLRSYLNRATTTTELAELAGVLRLEAQKDDRVDSLRVTVAPDTTGKTLTITLLVRPIDPAVGGFALTLSASDAGILIAEIRGET